MQYNIVFLLSLLILITSCNPDPCSELYLRKPNAYIDDTRTFVKTGSYETDPLYTGRCGLYYENNELRAIQEYLDGGARQDISVDRVSLIFCKSFLKY